MHEGEPAPGQPSECLPTSMRWKAQGFAESIAGRAAGHAAALEARFALAGNDDLTTARIDDRLSALDDEVDAYLMDQARHHGLRQPSWDSGSTPD